MDYTKDTHHYVRMCNITQYEILEDENNAICSFDESDLSQSPEHHEISDTIIQELHCRETHHKLKADLVDHVFTVVPNDENDG